MNSDEARAFLFGLAIGVILAIGAWGMTKAVWRMDLVARDLAQYCPVDGAFAFKGECEK
jgi:hypothetical protein